MCNCSEQTQQRGDGLDLFKPESSEAESPPQGIDSSSECPAHTIDTCRPFRASDIPLCGDLLGI